MVHEGISDEEYVAALVVLRRMIADVESDGDSWARLFRRVSGRG